MPRADRHGRQPVRSTRFPYRANPLFPSEMRGDRGPMIFDAVTGDYISRDMAIQSTYGLVDSRNGAGVDTDLGLHEMSVTMVGPNVPPFNSNLGRSGPGYPPNEDG